MCKAPATSSVMGLVYAGVNRLRVSWLEVGTQFTTQFRNHRFGTRAQWLRVRRILVLTRTVLGLSSKGAIHD